MSHVHLYIREKTYFPFDRKYNFGILYEASANQEKLNLLVPSMDRSLDNDYSGRLLLVKLFNLEAYPWYNEIVHALML